jgi:hypothetical protein
MTYTIDEHRHRFAAWAAGRAASVKEYRFSVEQGKAILEEVCMNELLTSPLKLPKPEAVDDTHRQWRHEIIAAASRRDLKFSHGVAAKLINIYLKAGFVCGGHDSHERVRALHPPIDSVLLKELSKKNVGGVRPVWNQAQAWRWSKLDSDQYETVIHNIRVAMPGAALWEVEQFWQGHQ